MKKEKKKKIWVQIQLTWQTLKLINLASENLDK